MKVVDTFQNRLKKAMLVNNIRQIDLVEKTNLDKTLINKYLAGVMKAKQDKLTILADALNVNEVWLMGYDVPMERNLKVDSNIDINDIPQTQQKLCWCPIYGKINAGLPNWAEECLEGYFPIPVELMNIVNPKEYFFLKVNR